MCKCQYCPDAKKCIETEGTCDRCTNCETKECEPSVDVSSERKCFDCGSVERVSANIDTGLDECWECHLKFMEGCETSVQA